MHTLLLRDDRGEPYIQEEKFNTHSTVYMIPRLHHSDGPRALPFQLRPEGKCPLERLFYFLLSLDDHPSLCAIDGPV